MSDIWKVIVFVIGSVGGVGTLIIGASTLIGRMLVERYAAKTELKINQELVKIKSELEENRSISEALFKKSFEVYGALVEKCQYMISDAYSLFSKHISTEEMQEICKKEDKTSLHKSLKSLKIVDMIFSLVCIKGQFLYPRKNLKALTPYNYGLCISKNHFDLYI